MRRFLTTLFFSLLAVSLCLAQPARHPFTFDDGSTLRSAHPVAVSPDGKTVLYRVSFGGAKGPDTNEWHLMNADGSGDRHLTLPEKFHPQGFNRDGSALYGTMHMDKAAQLATIPLAAPNTPAAAAATPVPLTALPRGVGSIFISPDGARYAILADPRLPDPLADVHTVIENSPSGIYVVNADGSAGAWWCPALRQAGEVAWSPDGSSLAVMSQTPKIGYHYVRSEIDVCNASGPRHVATIDNSAAGIGWINGGKDLAFVSTTSMVLTPDHVWTVPAAGGTPQDRTPKLDGSVLGLDVDAKGNAWATVARGVRLEVDSFANDSLTPAYTHPDGCVFGAPVSPKIASAPDVKVFAVGDPAHTTNVAVAHGNSLELITHEGDDQLAKVALGPVQAVHWTSKEGIPLEGIVTFPADYKPGQHYPFLVLPHGGPEGNDDLGFSVFPRFFAGMGYVVLEPEYRGSTGYGTEFHERDLPALRRPRLSRRGQRHRLRRRPGMGRPQSPYHVRLERGRLHDVMERDPDAPLQGGHRGRGHYRLGQLYVDQRRAAD